MKAPNRCIKCGTTSGVIQNHHVLPRVHFGKNDCIVPLCQTCHRKADKMMMDAEYKAFPEKVADKRRFRRLRRHDYYRIFIWFMKG